jgi:hypothetical protein
MPRFPCPPARHLHRSTALPRRLAALPRCRLAALPRCRLAALPLCRAALRRCRAAALRRCRAAALRRLPPPLRRARCACRACRAPPSLAPPRLPRSPRSPRCLAVPPCGTAVPPRSWLRRACRASLLLGTSVAPCSSRLRSCCACRASSLAPPCGAALQSCCLATLSSCGAAALWRLPCLLLRSSAASTPPLRCCWGGCWCALLAWPLSCRAVLLVCWLVSGWRWISVFSRVVVRVFFGCGFGLSFCVVVCWFGSFWAGR